MGNNVTQLSIRKRKPVNGSCEDSAISTNNKFLHLLEGKNPAEEARRIELEHGKESKWDYISNLVKRLYRSGARSHDIAPLFDVDDSTVRKWLSKIRTEQSEKMEKVDVYQHFAETLSIYESLIESAMDLVYSQTTSEENKAKAILAATRTLAAREKYLNMVGFYKSAHFEANRPKPLWERQADEIRERIIGYFDIKDEMAKELTPDTLKEMSDEDLGNYITGQLNKICPKLASALQEV